MSSQNEQCIELNNLKTGMKVYLVNQTDKTKKYTFKNGVYGEVTFTLAAGAQFEFKVGTEAPIIILDDAEDIDDRSVQTLMLH